MIVAVWLGSLVRGATAVGATTPEVVEIPQSQTAMADNALAQRFRPAAHRGRHTSAGIADSD